MSISTRVEFPAPAADLEVFVSVDDDATVVALRGEADAVTTPVIVETLARVIADRHGDVVVDLGQTGFIGTAALEAVVWAKDALDRDGRRLTIRSPSSLAARLLRIARLSELVSPEPTATR